MQNEMTLKKFNEYTNFKNELILLSSKLKTCQNNTEMCSKKINNVLSGKNDITLIKLNENISDIINKIDAKYIPELNKVIDDLSKQLLI